jgi:hypothetical protein
MRSGLRAERTFDGASLRARRRARAVGAPARLGAVGALGALGALAVMALAGCRDVSRFSTREGVFEGQVVQGSFVRTGNIAEDVRMCLTFDADHLQDGPGVLTTSDGRFTATPLRPIPQIWHDPLSQLGFGDGRVQNLVYAAAPNGEREDALVVISLMQSGRVEVRLVRGAPPADAAAPPPSSGAPLFGVFNLEKRHEACSIAPPAPAPPAASTAPAAPAAPPPAASAAPAPAPAPTP